MWGRIYRSIQVFNNFIPQFFLLFYGLWVVVGFFSSAPSLFYSVFDRSDEKEESKMSVFYVRVAMLLIIFI